MPQVIFTVWVSPESASVNEPLRVSVSFSLTGDAAVKTRPEGALLPELTVCGSAADVLPLKFEFPAYVAVRLFAPAVVKVSEQFPAATVPVQLTVPSLTVTLPVGVPVPGLFTVTL
jgi:hypothetical protein